MNVFIFIKRKIIVIEGVVTNKKNIVHIETRRFFFFYKQ